MNGACLFKGALVVNPRETFLADIRVRRQRIVEISTRLEQHRYEKVLDCSGLFACPGLINAHDHLQFNLYPRIGNPPYENSYEWGNDLHTRFRSTMETIERIPIRHRYLWGAWKNLFSGVTFVAHHDPYSYHFRFFFPIEVLKRYAFAHSLENEPNLPSKLNARRPNTPFIIHLAEGTDSRTAKEVESLLQCGGLDERTVAVHGVNINSSDIDILNQTKASVIWCPSSNQFLFGKTAPVDCLWNRVPVALGTDSTLTGSISLLDEMRCARSLSTRSAQEILQMVTEIPQRIFNLPSDMGRIIEGGTANLFFLLAHENPYETILNAGPEDIMLMMRQGSIVFHDERAFPTLRGEATRNSLLFGNRRKVLSDRRCNKLFQELRPFLGHYLYLSANSSRSSTKTERAQ